jgi:hypothetical protein
MENIEWDDDWQGKSEQQIEFSYTMIYLNIILLIITLILII